MRTKLRNFFLFASIAALAMGASAQDRPVGGNEAGNGAGNGGNTGWSYNPAKEGMKDLFQMRPIEGCNVAGGLQPITSSDEGDSAMFWCGTPPYCLTQPAIAAGEQCTILQYARRNPRYDPNGTPGANGVRDPDDLRCSNTGLPPINGRCPTQPGAGITLNNSTNLTVNKGGSVTLRVTTSGSQAEWGGSTSLSCTGTNSNRSPFNRTNVNDFLNRSNASVGSNTMPSNGTMTCTLTVTNARGSRTATAKVTVKEPSPPPSGGGGGGGGVVTPVDGGGCAATTTKRRANNSPIHGIYFYCVHSVPSMSNGESKRISGSMTPNGCPIRYVSPITFVCSNGVLKETGALVCSCRD